MFGISVCPGYTITKTVVIITKNCSGSGHIYIISGMLPIEAQVDIKILSFYGNVTRQENVSIE